jgi:phage tail sheath protein FI
LSASLIVPPEFVLPGVYVEVSNSGLDPIEGVNTSVTGFVDAFRRGPLNRSVRITGFKEFEREFGGLWQESPASYGIQQFFANGGQEAWVVRVPGGRDGRAGARALIGRAERATGLYALAAGDISLLCLPRAAELRPGQMRGVYAEAGHLCGQQLVFLLIDLPASVRDLPGLRAWCAANASLRNLNAAAFWPQVRAMAGRRVRALAPSGAIAGLYARTDTARGVWRAPAGANAALRATRGLTSKLARAEYGELSRLGVNGLLLERRGRVLCMGARTFLEPDSSPPVLQFVSVRRLALYLVRSIEHGTQWAVFEPNGERLWSLLRQLVTAFLYRLWQQGALLGSSAEEAFFVRCDRTTMTQADIDDGLVLLEIGFAPIKPAEFLVLRVTHRTAG